jgi:hypothetical protein
MVGKVSYPDFVTGNVLLLNWMETEHNSDNGFGTTYREFLTRDFLEKQDIDKLQTDFQEKQYSYNEFDSLQVVRAALNQVTDIPQSFLVSQSQKTSLDELFDEVVVVEPLAVPLKEPSDRSISSRPIFPNDFSVPAQIEAAVRRITKAAEKIEQAAEQSNGAGQQIKQAACFIETEIKTKLPAYVELFQELTEFQQMISRELNTKRSENQITKEPLTREPPKHQNQNQQERPVRLLPFPVRLNNGSTGSAQFVPEIKMPSATDESTLNEKSIDFQSLFQ